MPTVGDRIVFFYAPSGGTDPGIYGWAVVERCHEKSGTLYFIPATPTDHLKMDPWWNDEAKRVADDIHGPMKQATLFEVPMRALRSSERALRSGYTPVHEI